MQMPAAGQRFSKRFWITVLTFIGLGLLFNFGPIALLIYGFIVLIVKAFISAARSSDEGILLRDENGKLYRAFEVDDDSHENLFDKEGPFYSYRDDPAHPFSHYHDSD